MSERVDTLIVVACYEYIGTSRRYALYELNIHWVEILELVNYEMFDGQQRNRVQKSGRSRLHTLTDDFSWENTGIALSPRLVKGIKRGALRISHWRIRRLIVRRAPLVSVPKRLVFFPDFLAPPRRFFAAGREFRVNDVFVLPLAQDLRRNWVLAQLSRLLKDSERHGMQGRDGQGVGWWSNTVVVQPLLQIQRRRTREGDHEYGIWCDAVGQEPPHSFTDYVTLSRSRTGRQPNLGARVAGRLMLMYLCGTHLFLRNRHGWNFARADSTPSIREDEHCWVPEGSAGSLARGPLRLAGDCGRQARRAGGRPPHGCRGR